MQDFGKADHQGQKRMHVERTRSPQCEKTRATWKHQESRMLRLRSLPLPHRHQQQQHQRKQQQQVVKMY